MIKDKCLNSLDQYFKKIGTQSKSFVVSVNAPKLDINYEYHKDDENHHFFIDSIGKMFTAVLILMAIENKQITMDDPIEPYFDEHFLDQLFVYDDIDYQKKVTVKHLLNHTSGIADYFEGNVMFGESFIDMIINNREKIWTPDELIDFTRSHQKAIAKPGQKFYYSDTGYILLSLILEKIHHQKYDDIIKNHIFKPLKMEKTYLYNELSFHKKILPIELNGHDLTNTKSLTSDWSGGCAVSTAHDLTLFMKALHENKLIKKETFTNALKKVNRFHLGLYYGKGFMETRFEKFFFALKWLKLPKLIGHIGTMSSHVWLNPEDGTCIVIYFGSNRYLTKSFNVLIHILKELKKVKI
jgi:D-alanyl-D-alanine carboxypeptidase